MFYEDIRLKGGRNIYPTNLLLFRLFDFFQRDKE